MNVVVPLRFGQIALARLAEQARAIVAVLQHADRPCVSGPDRRAPGCFSFADEVQLAVVEHRMNGIESQAVELILLQPVQRVLDEEIAHGLAVLAVEVDRRTPGCLVALGEELRRVGVQPVPSGPKWL